jgi:hypothetical protein
MSLEELAEGIYARTTDTSISPWEIRLGTRHNYFYILKVLGQTFGLEGLGGTPQQVATALFCIDPSLGPALDEFIREIQPIYEERDVQDLRPRSNRHHLGNSRLATFMGRFVDVAQKNSQWVGISYSSLLTAITEEVGARVHLLQKSGKEKKKRGHDVYTHDDDIEALAEAIYNQGEYAAKRVRRSATFYSLLNWNKRYIEKLEEKMTAARKEAVEVELERLKNSPYKEKVSPSFDCLNCEVVVERHISSLILRVVQKGVLFVQKYNEDYVLFPTDSFIEDTYGF